MFLTIRTYEIQLHFVYEMLIDEEIKKDIAYLNP